MKRILIVDDDRAARLAIRAALRPTYFVIDVGRGEDALALLERQSFDLVICDVIMPEIDGLEVLRQIRELSPDLPVVMLSGGGRINSTDYLRIAGTFGAQRSLPKPVRIQELRAAVETLTRPTAA